MKKNNIPKLTSYQVLNSETAILIDQKPIKKYVDGKPTDEEIGTTFTVAAYANGLEQFNVKIEGAKPLDYTEEDLMSACASLNFIFVTFTDFVGKLYTTTDPNTKISSFKVSCSATGIKVVEKPDIDEVELFN